jgi:lysozyme
MEARNKARLGIASLVLSAAGFVGIVQHEGYKERAYIPVPGDRPTVGFGSTFKEDGTPVKMTDTATPQRAMRMSLTHISKDELQLKRCVAGPLYQAEYDILVDFAYWRGSGGACRSEVVKAINRGDYVASCEAYLNLDSRRATGKDCKDPSNGCRGVWLRAQDRHKRCMEAQQ